MRTLLSLFALLLVVTSGAQEFTAMSYNIRCGHCDANNTNNWDSRKELILSTVTKSNPDLIGFQEVETSQLQWLMTKLPTYSCYGTGRDADGQGEGCYIFYKKLTFKIDSTQSGTKWFSTTPDIAGSADMGDQYKRIITYVHLKHLASNKYFFHFNTHLTYLSEIQENHITFLTNQINALKHDEPFILTGDFNADESSKAIYLLKQNFAPTKLVDTFREIHPSTLISTFNNFTGEQDGRKIDYIFIENKYFKTIDAHCIVGKKTVKFPSDHNAMSALIQLYF